MSGETLFTASSGSLKAEFVDESAFNDPSAADLAGVNDSKSDTAPKDTGFPFLNEVPDKPTVKQKRPGTLAKQLESTYASVGMMVYVFDPHVGSEIVQNAPDCAQSLEELARTNPRVRRALESALTTSAWGAVIAAHLPILVVATTKYAPVVKDALKGKPPVTETSEQPVAGYQEFGSAA